MTARIDGGPAFPGGYAAVGDGDAQPYAAGMSLRDWFAGQVVVGMLAANPDLDEGADRFAQAMGLGSYKIADAMLAARKGGAA